MDELDRNWVAGLLEGEGCFSLQHSPNGRPQPRVFCEMCDEDVIDKLCSLAPFRRGRSPGLKENSKHNTSYRCHLSRQKEVFEFLYEVFPLMGDRRKSKINDIFREMGWNLNMSTTPWPEDARWSWLSGLLEGEGCFLCTHRNRNGKHCIEYAINLKMKDRDVVSRAQNLILSPSIRIIKNKNPNWSDMHITSLKRQKDVLRVCKRILPNMGERRSESIQKIIDSIESRIPIHFDGERQKFTER